MNTHKIEIDGNNYIVDLKAGTVRPVVKRKLGLKDISNGMVFKYKHYDDEFVMLNNQSALRGQLVCISGEGKGTLDYFGKDSSGFSYWDLNTKTWVSEIAD